MKLYVTGDGIGREAEDHSATVELLDLDHADIGSALEAGLKSEDFAAAPVKSRSELSELSLGPPVSRPGKVVCIGVNYASHIEELRTVMPSFETPERPIFFLVPGSAVTGPNDPIVLPRRWPDQVDYESELAIVIGTRAKNVDARDAWRYVAGLTMANDVSARDIQMQAMGGHEFNLTHAKGLDGFKPMGPCLATLDEFNTPPDVRIQCKVNGEVRQDASISDLVHDIPTCIAHVSTFMRLDPGDVLLTGSPAGVGFFQGLFLRAGDVVEVSGEGIGSMRNVVVREDQE